MDLQRDQLRLMQSLHSPASAKTYKTFQSKGKINLPRMIGKRNDLKLSWSLRGFEKMPASPFDFKSKRFFSFSGSKGKTRHLKKIQLKDKIVEAVHDEMNTIHKLFSVMSCKKQAASARNGAGHFFSAKTTRPPLRKRRDNVETTKRVFNFDFQDEPSQSHENELLFAQIQESVAKCSSVLHQSSMNWQTPKSQDMEQTYNRFREANFDRLGQVLVEYSVRNKAGQLQQFIMKFLLDIQSDNDVRLLRPVDLAFLQKFLVDRYFKLLKQKIVSTLAINGIFQTFVKGVPCESGQTPPAFSVTEMNEAIYAKFKDIWESGAEAYSNTFFGGEFERLFCKPSLNESELGRFLENFYFNINRVISQLIIVLISRRFKRAGSVFNDVEHVHKEVVSVVSRVVQIVGNLNSKNTPKDKKILFIRDLSQKLQTLLSSPSNEEFLDIIRYVKHREMREYMGRKRKSQFVKPRRNDEKLKKIYKRIMKNLLSDFKRSLFDASRPQPDPARPPRAKDMDFEDFLKEENSKLFVSDSDDGDSLFDFQSRNKSARDGRITVLVRNEMGASGGRDARAGRNQTTLHSNASSLKRRSMRFTSREQEKRFYEYYFGETARGMGLPLDHFFDPLKQKFGNSRFKSFTIKYFKLLLESPSFGARVIESVRGHRLVLDMLAEYSKLLGDLFQSVPTILLDQHKPKSKFLWTSYEFFFALFFFRDKFKL